VQKHVGHVHHERRLHRLMMKDELRVFEAEHASLLSESSMHSDNRSTSSSLTAATLAASRSAVGSVALATASVGPGNNSGRSIDEAPNLHVTLASSLPAQVCLLWLLSP
jgi:hypothetical protein